MKKIINITIGKTIFLIENDAYQKLENYLQEIKNYFSDDDDIVDDIEYSIAEKFTVRGFSSDNAIKLSDVQDIIAEMGTVADLTDETSQEDVQGTSSNTFFSRRLYRNLEDRVVGGVSSGIANYFSIDPILIRIAFCLLLFAVGFGVVISYIILWIAIPAADTTAKKVKMQGGEGTISEIEDFVKKNITQDPKSTFHKVISFPFEIIKRVATVLFRIIKKVIIIGGGIGGVLLSVVSSFLFFVFTYAFFYFIYKTSDQNETTQFIVDTISGGLTGIGSIIGFYVVIAIPLLSFVFLGLMAIRKKASFNWRWLVFVTGIWLASLAITLLGILPQSKVLEEGINKIEEKKVLSYQEKIYDNFIFSSITIDSAMDFDIQQGDEYKVIIRGPEADIENVVVFEDEDHLSISSSSSIERVRVCIYPCFDMDSHASVTVISPDLDSVKVFGSGDGKINLSQEKPLDLVSTGSSDVQLVLDLIDLNISSTGSGDVSLQGTSENAHLSFTGSGDVNAKEFSAYNMTIDSSGSSDFRVNAIENLDVAIQGSSDVYYVEHKELVVTENIYGSGSLRQILED